MSDLNTRARDALQRLHEAGRIREMWLPGMRMVDSSETLALGPVRVLSPGEGVRILPSAHPLFRPSRHAEDVPDWPKWVPGTSDDLTVMGLLLLLREATGDPLVNVAPSSQWARGCRIWVVWRSDPGVLLGWRELGRGPTEAEAVVVALEAVTGRTP